MTQDLGRNRRVTSVFQQWIWFATACVGWSMVLLLLVTMKWTPDCGGIAYGLPFPFLRSFVGSSLEFDFFVGPFLVDTLAHMLVISTPVWLFVRHVRKQSARRRRLYASVLALLVVFGFGLGAFTMLFGTHIEVWPREQLYVHEWRAKELHIGLPRWGSHLEGQCN